jgi:uncharacterized membrane protein
MVVMTEIESNSKIANREGMLCYLGGILFPIIYLTTKPYKGNRFIRFHAFQSIEFMVACVAMTITSDSNQHMGRIHSLLSGLWLLVFPMWIVLMFKAYRGEKFKLPILGTLAARWAG